MPLGTFLCVYQACAVCVCMCILTSCLDIDAACNASTAKTGHATTIHRWPKYVREVAAMKDEARVPVREAPDQRTPPTRSPKHQHPIPHQQQHHTTTTRPVPPPRHACRGTLRVRGADSLLSVDRAKWFSPAANAAKNTAHDAELLSNVSSEPRHHHQTRAIRGKNVKVSHKRRDMMAMAVGLSAVMLCSVAALSAPCPEPIHGTDFLNEDHQDSADATDYASCCRCNFFSLTMLNDFQCMT
jgi:hypothetical protein